jgi:hypothetical protein
MSNITPKIRDLDTYPDMPYDVIHVGDIVRSFDFADINRETGERYGRDLTGDRAAYIVGVVEEIADFAGFGYNQYKIRVVSQISGGSAYLGQDYYYPPVNGTPTFGGRILDGVEKV